MKTFLICAALFMSLWTDAVSAQTIFIVRHAEKVDESRDPELSAKGQQRAINLAHVLRDAAVDAIFVTEFQRTQWTAKPLAQARQLPLQNYAAKESQALGKQLLIADRNTLVVGHSNTLLEILKGMGITDAKAIADDEYDRLLIVNLQKSAKPSLLQLRY